MTELLDSEQRQGLMIEQHVEEELANDPPNDLMWWRRLFRAIDKWAPPGQRLLLVTSEGRVIGEQFEVDGQVEELHGVRPRSADQARRLPIPLGEVGRNPQPEHQYQPEVQEDGQQRRVVRERLD